MVLSDKLVVNEGQVRQKKDTVALKGLSQRQSVWDNINNTNRVWGRSGE
jgi:hypothetical protein